MNKLLLFISLVLLVSCSKPSIYECPPNVEKHYTEDMKPYIGTARDITISLADTVEGRATYNVSFPDGTGLDSMYPEEIAHGLLTGKWSYNEDLQVK